MFLLFIVVARFSLSFLQRIKHVVAWRGFQGGLTL